MTCLIQLTSGAVSGRSDDTGGLKYDGLNYVMDDPTTPLTPSLTGTFSKAGRGCHHPVLARLICPINKLSEYDDDPIA